MAIRPSLRRTEYEAELIRQGFNVVTSDNGADSINRLRAGSVDLVVLESDLPSEGGEAVLEVMSTSGSLCDIPVLVVIPDFNWASTYRIARYRINDFAIQPCPVERFVSRVMGLAYGGLIPADQNK